MPQVPYTDDLYKLPDRVSAGGTEVLNVPNYGGMIARGLGQFGQGAGDLSNAAFQIQRQDDITAVQGAMNDLMQHGKVVQYGDPSDPMKPGFLGLKDKAALDAWQPTADGFRQYQQSLMNGLTPAQQRIFAQESEPFMNGALGSLAAHAAGQRQSYQDNVQDATLSSLASSGAANSDNPAAFANAYAQGKQNIIARNATLGYGADHPVTLQNIQKWNDSYFHTAIITAAQKGDAISARNMLLSNERNMSAPVFAQTMSAIRPEYDRQVGDNLANEVWNDHGGPQAVPPDADPSATMQNMLLAESGGRQKDKDGNTITSGKGAIGIAQMLPATAEETARRIGIPWDENRFLHDENYNRALGQAYFHQLCDKYGNNQTLACAAYNAGPGTVDKWLKQYGDPRTGAISDEQFVQSIPYDETQRYVSRVASSLSRNAPAPSATPPDLSAKLSEIHRVAQERGYDQEIEDHAMSRAMHNNALWDTQTRDARASLHGQINDLSSAYMNGNTQNQVPEQQIRSLYQPDEADRIVSGLNERRQAGLALNALKWAAPAQVGAYMQASQAALGDANVDDFATRTQINAHLQQAMARRMKALNDDPAGYAAGHPAVQQAWQDYQQNQTPEAFEAYAGKLRAVQQMIGVSNPRYLTSDQAHNVISGLAGIDATKQKIAPIMDGMKQHYGKAWDGVLNELVQSGLPAPYAVIANMDTPQQGVARDILQRNLQTSPDDLKRLAGPEASQLNATASNDPVGNSLADLRQTMMLQKGGETAYRNIYDTMKMQAMGYMGKGLSISDAITKARKDIVDLKYDTSGYLRTPKGEMDTTQDALAMFISQLKPDDISVAALPGVSDKISNEQVLDNARSTGKWVANDNANGNGYSLMIPSKTAPGEWQYLQGRDGNPIIVRRDDILAGRYGPDRKIAVENWKRFNLHL